MTRYFTWCSENFAKFCHKEHHIHIAITSPDSKGIEVPCGNPTLNLFFYDLSPETIKETETFEKHQEKWKKFLDGCFTRDHAKKIMDFVRSHSADVIVNCEAGVSRSPAVVLALRAAYGGDTQECFNKAIPNLYVANLLGGELGVGPFQNPKYDGMKRTSDGTLFTP